MNDVPRTYLVVGGGTGIGLALTRRLVDEGSSVTVWSRTAHDELADLPVEHVAVDVTQPLDGVRVPDALDGVVYCPGSITLAPFSRLSDDAFLKDYTVNLLGAVRVLRLALPILADRPGSSVVLFSTVAVDTGLTFHASIASAKAAVEGLARSLAAEYAPKRVRVNVVAPSLTDTPLAAQLLSNDKKREASAERHPLGRVGTPADIAAAAHYLLGPDSGWITGQVFHLDGGMSALR